MERRGCAPAIGAAGGGDAIDLLASGSGPPSAGALGVMAAVSLEINGAGSANRGASPGCARTAGSGDCAVWRSIEAGMVPGRTASGTVSSGGTTHLVSTTSQSRYRQWALAWRSSLQASATRRKMTAICQLCNNRYLPISVRMVPIAIDPPTSCLVLVDELLEPLDVRRAELRVVRQPQHQGDRVAPEQLVDEVRHGLLEDVIPA